ncbi:MAG: hypothetical protein Q8M07_00515 [Prosthecobacter sp.]|nr:hypothetical protein [Prosthecobacter sp.]
MIPEHLRNFLRTTIKSVWALDLLVLLRNSPGQTWTVVALNNGLRASTTLVEEILVSFIRSGLVTVEPDGTYRYAPATTEIGALAADVTRLYGERPVSIIKEIMTAPNDKLHSFVDAFRLKKD